METVFMLNNFINSDKRNTILNLIYKGQILKEKTKQSEHGLSFFIIFFLILKLFDIDMIFQDVRSTDKTNVSCPGDSSSTLGKDKTLFVFD